jgi:hypothetical protein
VFFKDRWYGFDDGLYTGALLNSPPNSHSTPELQLKLEEGENFELVTRLQKITQFTGADDVVKFDGLRVEYPDGFGLARSSNTTPVVAMRFEADNDTALLRIQDDFRRVLPCVRPSAHVRRCLRIGRYRPHRDMRPTAPRSTPVESCPGSAGDASHRAECTSTGSPSA